MSIAKKVFAVVTGFLSPREVVDRGLDMLKAHTAKVCAEDAKKAEELGVSLEHYLCLKNKYRRN